LEGKIAYRRYPPQALVTAERNDWSERQRVSVAVEFSASFLSISLQASNAQDRKESGSAECRPQIISGPLLRAVRG